MIASILVHLDGHITRYERRDINEMEEDGEPMFVQRDNVAKDVTLKPAARKALLLECTKIKRLCDKIHRAQWQMVRVDNPKARVPELWQSYCTITGCNTQIQFGFNPLET